MLQPKLNLADITSAQSLKIEEGVVMVRFYQHDNGIANFACFNEKLTEFMEGKTDEYFGRGTAIPAWIELTKGKTCRELSIQQIVDLNKILSS